MKNLADIHKIFWKSDYSVRVVEIDKQHKKIFQWINLLSEALIFHDRSVVITVTDVLHELDDYAKYHFENEEKYFDQFNYKESENHKKEHQEYIRRINLFKNRLISVHREKDNMTTFALDLFEFIEGWWTAHIIYSDRKYSKCFNEHGLF